MPVGSRQLTEREEKIADLRLKIGEGGQTSRLLAGGEWRDASRRSVVGISRTGKSKIGDCRLEMGEGGQMNQLSAVGGWREGGEKGGRLAVVSWRTRRWEIGNLRRESAGGQHV